MVKRKRTNNDIQNIAQKTKDREASLVAYKYEPSSGLVVSHILDYYSLLYFHV